LEHIWGEASAKGLEAIEQAPGLDTPTDKFRKSLTSFELTQKYATTTAAFSHTFLYLYSKYSEKRTGRFSDPGSELYAVLEKVSSKRPTDTECLQECMQTIVNSGVD
jgi:hypothetical protein